MSRRMDPAPSRLSYRLQRLWLTPFVRRVLTMGPPMALAAGAVTYMALTPSLQRQMRMGYEDLRAAIVNREEFRVDRVAVNGASPELMALVADLTVEDVPSSSLAIDLNRVRDRIEAVPAVSEAAVRVGPGGVLQIDLDEREASFVWRQGDRLSLIDASGLVLSQVSRREDRPRLPLVIGAGAAERLDEARDLLYAAQPIAGRIRGVQRIGDRRWNIVLDKDQMLLLPEHEPVTALQKIMDLHALEDVLNRDVVAVDYRDTARPVLRLGPFGESEIRRVQAIERGRPK